MKIRSSLIGSLIHREHCSIGIRNFVIGTAFATALAGCATTNNANTASSEQEAAAPVVESQQESAQEVSNAQQASDTSEANADAMMASLAAKSKFDEQEEKAASKPKPKKKVAKVKKPAKAKSKPAVVAKKAAPKAETPKVASPDVKESAPVVAKQAVQEKSSSSKSSSKPLNASIKDLPIEYGVWKIGKGVAVLDKDIVITTPTWEMGEPGFMSQIWITIMDDKLLINSSSDIMAPKTKTGIKIDGSELIPFDRIVEDKIGVLDGDEWLGKLAKANELEIYMGFFPDRVPKSGIYKSNLTLEKLARVAATYEMLN